MALRALVNPHREHKGTEMVSLNPKFQRVGFFKKSYELLAKHSDGELKYVLVLLDDDRPNQFWVKPCSPDTPGSRKVTSVNSTNSIYTPMLFKSLPNKPTETVHAKIEWDKKEGAARVNLGDFAKKV